MNQHMINDFLFYLFFLGLLVHLVFIIAFVYKLNKMYPFRYILNKEKKMVFYPYHNKEGYIATPEQVEACAKAYKTLCCTFGLNILGFKKDIDKIFAVCEKITTPLPFAVCLKNADKMIGWGYLFLWFLFSLSIILIELYFQNYYDALFFAMYSIFILMISLIKIGAKFSK